MTFFIPCCVNKDNNNENNNFSKASDLNLIIEINNESLKNNINLSFKLINIQNYAIIIEDYFIPDNSILELFLTVPNNETFYIPLGISDRLTTNYIILETGEFLEFQIFLKDFPIYYKIENGTYIEIMWDWTFKGIYEIWATYKISPSEIIYSNILEFEII